MRSIFSISHEEFIDYLNKNGFEPFRARQVFDWIYNKKVISFENITNIPKNLKDKLREKFFIISLSEIDRKKSVDGTSKLVYKIFDNNIIETVVIPNSIGRHTLCVSTQVGCPIGCSFCATGLNGFKRNLSLDEMISQFYLNSDVSNIVLMGMGEPFLNPYLWDFLEILTSVKYFNFSSRSITVSTVGIIEGIKKLALNKQIKLAISYHSGVKETRKLLFPKVFDKIDFNLLIDSLEEYQKITNKRITLEFLLIKGVNDNVEEAKVLLDISKKISFNLNIIPYNKHVFASYEPPLDSDIKRFISYFKGRINYTIRKSKGQDIYGACGQLAGEKIINKLY